MPDDSPIPGRDAEEMALNGSVLSTVKFGGPDLTAGSTIFELLVALCTPRICNSTIMIGRCRWGEYFQCPWNL